MRRGRADGRGRRRPSRSLCPTAGFAFVVAAAVAVVICLGVGVGPTSGVARASTVVLVRPPRPSAESAEATVRLRGELVSAGFDVRMMDAPIGADIRASLEQAAAGPDVEAVVAILGDSGDSGGAGDSSGADGTADGAARNSAELWVIDRVTGKTVVRRVPNQAGSPHAAEALSIRALELLRASFLEVALSAERTSKAAPRQPPAPVEVTRFAETALAEAMDAGARSSWAVEVGGAVLGSLDGMPASLLPIVRVQRGLGERFVARVTLAGLGTPAHLDTPSGGTADVSQQFGIVEAAARFRVGRRIQPFASLGAGVLHVSAVGQASLPYQGLSQDRWSAVADAGAGVRLRLARRFELALEAHAQVASPYPLIRFIDTEVAREGRLARPTLLGSLTLLAWM